MLYSLISSFNIEHVTEVWNIVISTALKEFQIQVAARANGAHGLGKICAAKVAVKWIANWICTHPEKVKRIYEPIILTTKRIFEKWQEKGGKLKRQDFKQMVDDAIGIAFFEKLENNRAFIKDLENRILRRKTTPNPTGKLVMIRISVFTF